jgi:hypothetical protein
MLYIMHRTQLYLDEDLWTTLQTRARLEGTTISELVRSAAREKYMSNRAQRVADMTSVIGIWKDYPEFEAPGSVDAYIRDLRKSRGRLKRIYAE